MPFGIGAFPTHGRGADLSVWRPMHLDDVTDERSFGGYVATLLPEAASSGRALDAYLCALLAGVLRARDAEPSYRLFGGLLKAALADEAPAYDTVLLERLAAGGDGPAAYERVVGRLAEQILDLRQMRAAGTLDRSGADLWLGQDGPSGRRWYNFTIRGYLEPTSRDWETREVDAENEVSWLDFDFVLLDGQHCE